MGERAFEANGLDNDDAFRDYNHHGESKEEPPIEIGPSESTRADLVENMCKWFGSKPLNSEKDTDTTNCPLRNHNASATLTEEGQWGRHNGKASEQISRVSSALMQARIWEQIAPPQDKAGCEPSLNNMRWVASEPPTLSDEEEGCTAPLQHNSPSKESCTKMNSTTIWFTPSDRSSKELRGRTESDNSFQSLSYFTAMAFEIDERTIDLECEEDESAEMGHKESNHEMEARIMAAFGEYIRNESSFSRSDEEWWINDDGSCNSADLSSIHTTDTNDRWDEDEPNDNPNRYKYKTIDQFFIQQNEKSNETNTNEELELITAKTEELYQYQIETIDKFYHQECVGEDKCNRTPDKAKPTAGATTDDMAEATEEIDLPDQYETWEVEPIEDKIDKQTAGIIGLQRLIRFNTQPLLPWTNIEMKQGDDCNSIKYELPGYGHYITRLICIRLYMVRMICIAIELQALLRRCSYPKRDVIRWSSV